MLNNKLIFGSAIIIALCLHNAAEARGLLRGYQFHARTRNTVVLVQDLPNIEALYHADGKYIDLGYNFSGATEGEWVGHIGSDTTYVPLHDGKLERIMVATGINKLPDIPPRPVSSYELGGIFFTLLTAIGVFFVLGKSASRLFGKSNSAV